MADQLLDNIIRQLMGPTLVVDSARKVIFASDSLRTLLGRNTNLDSCESLFLAPQRNQCGVCCWDVIDDYLGCGCQALWPMRRGDGSWVSTLCQLSVVDIAGAHGLVHMRIRPLEAPLERDMALYRAMRAGMAQTAMYRQWAAQFFAQHGKCMLDWLDPADEDDPRVAAVLAGLARVGTDAPFDIQVVDGKRTTVRRVIAAEGPEGLQLALLQSKDGKLRPGELLAAWAVVRIAAERRDQTQLSNMGALILLEGLSPRKQEVLALVLDGLTDSAIAVRLGLSAHTVKNHVRHIMDKCGVQKRMQLAAIARAA